LYAFSFLINNGINNEGDYSGTFSPLITPPFQASKHPVHVSLRSLAQYFCGWMWFEDTICFSSWHTHLVLIKLWSCSHPSVGYEVLGECDLHAHLLPEAANEQDRHEQDRHEQDRHEQDRHEHDAEPHRVCLLNGGECKEWRTNIASRVACFHANCSHFRAICCKWSTLGPTWFWIWLILGLHVHKTRWAIVTKCIQINDSSYTHKWIHLIQKLLNIYTRIYIHDCLNHWWIGNCKAQTSAYRSLRMHVQCMLNITWTFAWCVCINAIASACVHGFKRPHSGFESRPDSFAIHSQM